MSDTPRTERLLETMEREKKDIWQALKIVTDWARGLERECASFEAHLLRPEASALAVLREIIGECETKPGPIWKHIAVPDELYQRAKKLCEPQRERTPE